jgi:hypothetical protein
MREQSNVKCVWASRTGGQQTRSYHLQSALTSVGSETTLSMIISGQGMFANKHVMIYKIYEKP